MFGLKWRPSWFFSKWRPARGRSSWRSAKIETVSHSGHMSQIWCFWKNLNQKSLRSLTMINRTNVCVNMVAQTHCTQRQRVCRYRSIYFVNVLRLTYRYTRTEGGTLKLIFYVILFNLYVLTSDDAGSSKHLQQLRVKTIANTTQHM